MLVGQICLQLLCRLPHVTRPAAFLRCSEHIRRQRLCSGSDVLSDDVLKPARVRDQGGARGHGVQLHRPFDLLVVGKELGYRRQNEYERWVVLDLQRFVQRQAQAFACRSCCPNPHSAQARQESEVTCQRCCCSSKESA